MRAQALLKEHQAAHKTLAQQLLKQETVSGSDVKEALENNRAQETLLLTVESWGNDPIIGRISTARKFPRQSPRQSSS